MQLLDLPVELVALVAPRLGLQALGRWASTAKGLPCADTDWLAALLGRLKQRMPATLLDKQWAALFGLSVQTPRKQMQSIVEALARWETCSVEVFRTAVTAIHSDKPDDIVRILRRMPRMLVQTHFDKDAPTYTNHFTLVSTSPGNRKATPAAITTTPVVVSTATSATIVLYVGTNTDAVPILALLDMINAAPVDTVTYKRLVQCE